MNLGKQLSTHVDVYLGPIPSAVISDDSLGVSVARFDDVPNAGLVTSITVGLSGHLLEQAVTRRPIRQELLTCFDRAYMELPWQEVMLAASRILLDRHAPFLLGEVVGPMGPIFPEVRWCNVTALLCAPPAFFEADFSELRIEDGTELVFVELIPITTDDANWVQQHGWSAFFDRVNVGEIDIMDLRRS